MDKPEHPIHQRLNFLIQQLEDGVHRRFAQRLGVSSGAIGDIMGQRKSKPGFDFIGKILRAYPQLRPEWLLLGEGEMLKNPASSENSTGPQIISSYIPPAEGVNAQVQRHMSEEEGMPSYGIKPSAKPKTPMLPPVTLPPPLPGLDLIQQVAANTAAIKRILAILESQQQHESSRSN